MTMLLRLLNPQGIVGLALSLSLGLLLVLQKGETHHWKKQSSQFEQLYHSEQASFSETVANYRAAAGQAKEADKANAERAAAEQRSISERTSNEFESRLAAARAAAQRLRASGSAAAADPRARAGAPVPRVSTAAARPAQAAGKDQFPASDSLTATEQAIQLDELIKWVRQQHSVDPNSR